MTSSKIDIKALEPLLKQVGWSIPEAQASLGVDLTKPASPELKTYIWQAIKTAKFWRQIYPQARLAGMRYLTPGGGSGGGG